MEIEILVEVDRDYTSENGFVLSNQNGDVLFNSLQEHWVATILYDVETTLIDRCVPRDQDYTLTVYDDFGDGFVDGNMEVRVDGNLIAQVTGDFGVLVTINIPGVPALEATPDMPTLSPTTSAPSSSSPPSLSPTTTPTTFPSSSSPSSRPTPTPSQEPTSVPSEPPSIEPTDAPAAALSLEPSTAPSIAPSDFEPAAPSTVTSLEDSDPASSARGAGRLLVATLLGLGFGFLALL